MREHKPQVPGRSAASASHDTTPAPGHTTLVEQIDPAPPAETGDRAHETAMLAYLASAKPAAPPSTPALDAENKLKTGGDNPDQAFNVAHAPKHTYQAAHGPLNPAIHDPKGGHVELQRPGVTLGTGSHKHDEFELIDDDVKQTYLIDLNKGGQLAIKYKTLSNAQIKAHDGRFAVNPAHSRDLILPDDPTKPQHCVLTWFGNTGSAWMRTADLKDGDKIGRAADRFSHKDNPHAPKSAISDTTRFKVRDGGIAKATPRDHDRYMRPHQQSTTSNHKSDYLEDDHGRVNLCQTLPGGQAAAIAIDVLMAGQYFFVPNEADHKVPSKYVREVAVYLHGAANTTARQVWVFGFVGKTETEPDETRSGWLPLRVVEAAPL